MLINNTFPKGRILLAAALLLGFFVNMNTLQNGFGWDDDEIVPNMSQVENWGQIFFPPGAGDVSGKALVYYRPIIKASYYLDYRIWGEKPFGFHLSVLLFHLLNTALVFSLARTLVGEGEEPPINRAELPGGKGSVSHGSGFPGGVDFPLWVGFLSAVLFSIHPIHAEAVAWIAGRNDVLCTTFMLGAFLCYVRFHRDRGKYWLGFSFLLFLFALLTKETAVFLPGVFLIYEGLMWARTKGPLPGGLGFRVFLMVLVEAVYFGVRSSWSNSLASGPGKAIETLSGSMAGKGLTALGVYFKMLLVPFPHQPFIESLPPSGGYIVFGLLALVVSAGVMVRAIAQKRGIVGVGLAWTLFLMVPAVLVSIIPVAAADAAERYLYPASAGWVVVLSFMALKGAGRLAGRGPFLQSRGGKAFLGLVVLLVAVGSLERWNRNTVWRNQTAFWEAATRLNPESGLPFLELGTEYAKAGELQKAELWLGRAVSKLDKSRGPHSLILAKTYTNLGELYRLQGRVVEAEEAHLKVLRIRQAGLGLGHPDVGKTYFNLGLIKQSQGQLNGAEEFYKKAISTWEISDSRAGSELTKTLNNLAAVVGSQGRHEEAAELFGQALTVLVKQFGPSHPKLLNAMDNYALALKRSGKVAEAEKMEKQAKTIRGF